MFTLVSDESTQKLGIGKHLTRAYRMATTFMTVRAAQDLTRKDFTAAVSPNYESLSELKTGEVRERDANGKKIPGGSRSTEITLGYYDSLDVIQETVTALEAWYKTVLSRHGAEHRVLVEEGNHYNFKPDDNARSTRLGDAILQARVLQAFDMVRQEYDVDYTTVVGKIMPIFIQSIGLPGYAVSHDLTKEGFGKVDFLLEELANFTFYKPVEQGAPCYMQRRSYRGHDNYYLTYEGEVTGASLKSAVLDWLLGAAKERINVPYSSVDDFLENVPVTTGRLVAKPRDPNPIIEPHMAVRLSLMSERSSHDLPENVVQLFPR